MLPETLLAPYRQRFSVFSFNAAIGRHRLSSLHWYSWRAQLAGSSSIQKSQWWSTPIKAPREDTIRDARPSGMHCAPRYWRFITDTLNSDGRYELSFFDDFRLGIVKGDIGVDVSS